MEIANEKQEKSATKSWIVRILVDVQESIWRTISRKYQFSTKYNISLDCIAFIIFKLAIVVGIARDYHWKYQYHWQQI